MGISYVIMGVALGLVLTAVFNIAGRAATNLPSSQGVGNVGTILSLMVVPFSAVVGLLITTPIYLLYVADKNAGLLEYLLAVGMGQRSVFWGYLKAALLLSLVGMVPMLLLNMALDSSGFLTTAAAGVISLVTVI